MKKNPSLFLEHILESINLIEQYTGTIKKGDFLDSVSVQDMVIRRLEIIGEAVKYLPDGLNWLHRKFLGRILPACAIN